MYVTHAEHSGMFGQHTASSAGHRQQHDNLNPVTQEPLAPSDLITLHYSRKATGELHDPISFKEFSEHSHIVAIVTTGNVFLADSVKGGKDLVSDTSFKKADVITLQNPHGLPTASVSNVVTAAKSEDKTVAKVAAKDPIAKTKAAVPWNVSPYSTGLPGASLTSTSVDPHTQTSQLVWDEEEIMFDDFANPPKGKGKEKDVGRRRAYVRVVTSLGGSLNLELYCEKAPKTCYNFLMLAKAGKYNNCSFHRLVPGFMVSHVTRIYTILVLTWRQIQTGDPTGTGAGGESYWGTPFRDEHDMRNAAKHDSRGVLAMANKGAGTNGSQFYLTFKATPHLDKKHTVFGKLVGGEEVLDALEAIPVKPGTERPSRPVKITEVVIFQDPFEEYKNRQQKLRARKVAAVEGREAAEKAPPTREDETNWFGHKIGLEKSGLGASAGAGVGKYLHIGAATAKAGTKRPAEPLPAAALPDDGKKKRKIGFGNFDGW
ncbi:hypothetical protein EUX98_g643 [Antrodiella citrinella]|uniref:PPIase cyclophilin-type domain-containing protein n=1 Tax=Antrodiella citrinella TaxID=2447956 RepID=A0A4S4N5Q2_9APHY|nr:hypothetical protein EUX98_g643 [Antrodiella citrinella]